LGIRNLNHLEKTAVEKRLILEFLTSESMVAVTQVILHMEWRVSLWKPGKMLFSAM